MNFDERLNLYVINGNYHQNKLQDLLDDFIQQFVLCRSCGNPETELVNEFIIEYEIYLCHFRIVMKKLMTEFINDVMLVVIRGILK